MHILIESGAGPEGVALIAVDLVEGISDADSPALQLDMHQREAVDKDCYVIAVGVGAALGDVLVDDLQGVVVDISFVDERDVDERAVGAGPGLDVVFLNGFGFLNDAHVGIADVFVEEPDPFVIVEAEAVEAFDLAAEVGNEFLLGVDWEIFVGLACEAIDEVALHVGFGLILRGAIVAGFKFGDDGRFGVFGDKVVRGVMRIFHGM